MANKSKQKHKESADSLPSNQPAQKLNGALHLGKDCDYDRELRRLQIELVKLQEWIRHERHARGGAV